MENNVSNQSPIHNLNTNFFSQMNSNFSTNLLNDYENLLSYSKQSLETITNLNDYYKSVYKYGELFCLNTRRSIEVFFNEQIKIDTKTTLSKNMFEFYRNYEDFIIKTKELISKINKDIIDPIGIFHLNISTIYDQCFEDLRNLAYSTPDIKKNLEKIKIKYYESCKIVQEQEKIVCKTFTGKILDNDEEINSAHDNLLRLRSQSDNLAQMYRYEISNVNKILEDNQKKYNNIMEKIRTNEESRIYFLKCSMEKFTKIYEEFTITVFDFLNRLNTNLVEINMEEDIKLFNEKFKFKENLNLFKNQKEEFVSYDSFKKLSEIPQTISKTDSITNIQYTNYDSNYDYYSNRANNSASSQTKIFSLDVKPDVSITEDFEFITESQFYSEKFQLNLMENFLRQLYSEKEIEVDSMGKVMEILYNNPTFSKTFIDYILKDRKNIFIKFVNYQNLQHFANILNTISLSLENTSSENFELNFAIIFIAERSFYYDKEKNTKTYLCAILSKNKLFATRTFWLDLIELKLSRRIEEQLNRLDKNLLAESQIGFSSKNDSIVGNSRDNLQSSYRNDFLNPNTTNNTTGNNNLLSNIGSKLKNIFNKDNIGKNQSPQSKSRKNSNALSKSVVKNYENLSSAKKIIVDKITITELSSIIKEYIPHFVNFNYEISEAIDIIVELSTKYRIPKEKISFFVTYLNSSVFTIKNKLPNKKEELERKRSRFNNSFVIKSTDYKISIISSCLKYLKPPEFSNLTLLNRTFNEKIKKKIYKLQLSECDDVPSRLKIWKSILKVNKLKEQYDYKNILDRINNKSDGIEKLPYSVEEVINLDVQRTFFESNIEESRNAIANILKSIADINPKINYCQGMNYVASFLFQLCQNEEETFYLMLGLFLHTEFSLIFVEDLLRLKIFFYVFDRLVSLYLPELYSYFKTNSIIVNYFCSPWFITLFTNSYPYTTLVEPPLVILKIWDDYLLDGWKALMRTGICLLKNYEKTLITLKYEDLLHFLINDLVKSGFFTNKNYEHFLVLIESTKIKSELINNLENENFQEMKIREMEDKKR